MGTHYQQNKDTIVQNFSFYKKYGYQKLGDSFISTDEIQNLKNIMSRADSVHEHDAWYNSIFRKGGCITVLRAMHIPGHPLYSETLHNIVKRNAHIAAEIICKKEVYVKQCKINMKLPGNIHDSYGWHSDFITWKARDRIKRHKDVVNIIIFIDDVPVESGPLIFIPMTHNKEHIKIDLNKDEPIPHHIFIDPELIEYAEEEIKENGVIQATGKSGDAYAFNPNLLHSSAINTTNLPRRIIVIAYNSCDNLPAPKNAVPAWTDSPYVENINV